MDQVVYRPRYKFHYYLGLVAFLIWGVGSVWISYEAVADPLPGMESHPLRILMWLVIAAFCFGVAARTVREIRFGSTIVVKRYLWPSEIYNYNEVNHVSQRGVELDSGSIRLRNVKEESVDELRELMEDLAERGRLQADQLEHETMLGKVVLKSVALWGSIAVGLLFAVVVWKAGFSRSINTYIKESFPSGEELFLFNTLVATLIVYYPLRKMAEIIAENTNQSGSIN